MDESFNDDLCFSVSGFLFVCFLSDFFKVVLCEVFSIYYPL